MVKKKVYISASGMVSPQKTFDNCQFLEEIVSLETQQLKTVDPNYKEFIPADMVRRMSRVIKMGVAASKICLAEAQCDNPDAIITGTGLGCLDDTEKFLSAMILNKEEFLTPTSFIQSTHNTVGGQIALLLKCHNYNFTYVHRGVSFESALLDAMVKLESGSLNNVLLGSSDEITKNSFAIQNRLGFWKQKPVNNLDLFLDTTRGTIAGEGSAFFFLGNTPSPQDYAEVVDVETFTTPQDSKDVINRVSDFLSKNGLLNEEIDWIITGKNGNPTDDSIYDYLTSQAFPSSGIAAFKHLCGEFHTAVSFAFWLGAKMMKLQKVPGVVRLKASSANEIRTILIYNHYRNEHHSFIILRKA